MSYKHFFPSIFILSSSSSPIIFRLRTGHCKLNSHLHRIKLHSPQEIHLVFSSSSTGACGHLLHGRLITPPLIGHRRSLSRCTHLFLLHQTCWITLISQVTMWQTGRIINGAWNGKKILPYSMVLFQRSAHHHREYVFPEVLGSSSIAFVLAWASSAQLSTNGVWLHLRPVSVVLKSRL